MFFFTGVGSRKTPPRVWPRLEDIARDFTNNGLTLRSGAAEGADEAFERGAGDNKEIWLPWPRFRNHPSRCIVKPAALTIASQYHALWNELSRTDRLLHGRNVHQVLGADLKTPSVKLVCWTPGGKWVGGTATALKIARDHSIPIWNLGESE